MNESKSRINNPYIIGSSIDDPEKFFGRDSLFDFIKDNLKQGTKVMLLHGQRRIGKSSVLQQIPNKVLLDGFIFVPCDLQHNQQSTLSEILHGLAAEIVDYLELNQENISVPTVVALEEDLDIFSRYFLPKVYQQLNQKKLVLLLDEFDVIIDSSRIPPQKKGLFDYLQAIIKKQNKLFIIPVLGRYIGDLPTLLRLFKGAPNQEIAFLDDISAKRLITKPAQNILRYEQDAINAIIELSAGHPYFTQVICFSVFLRARKLKNWEVTRADVTSIVDKAIENAHGGLVWFWEGLSVPEKVILSAVADAQNTAHENKVSVPENPLTLLEAKGVKITDSLLQASQQLAKKGFLDKQTQRIVRVDLVHRWLMREHPLTEAIRELGEVDAEEINDLKKVAVRLLKRGEKQNAMDIYEQILKLNPNQFQTIETLAKEYLKNEEFDKAIELYRRTYKVDPVCKKEGLVFALETYGRKLIIQQRFSQAMEQYNQVLEIEPDRKLAQEKLEEIKAYEQQRRRERNDYEFDVLTWRCQGYRDIPHSSVVLRRDEECPRCSRSFTSNDYSSQYSRKRLLRIIKVVAGIVLVGLGFGAYRALSSCPEGRRKAWAILCVAHQRADNISRGERPLFSTKKSPDRDQGIEFFKKGNYSQAAQFFKKAVVVSKNDPEVLIYYNNARAKQQGLPLTLAVVVPVDNKPAFAQEMLRGVAQAQNEFNDQGGFNGRLLEIVIANDGNKPEIAKQMAQVLINDSSVLGVIGHNASGATQAALDEYKKANFPIISPTSTSPSLTGDIFFRTTFSDAAAGKRLAQYARNTLNLSKVAILYNPKEPHSDGMREEFTKNFELQGGEVVRKIDLTEPKLDVEKEVPRSVWRYEAQAALLFPDTLHTSVALKFAHANADLMASPTNRNKRGLKLLAGDALYNQTTLDEGGNAVEGLILPVPWFKKAPQSEMFAKKAQQQWGGDVSWRTATSFDATQAFIKALSSTNKPSHQTVLQKLRDQKLSEKETSGKAFQFTREGERGKEQNNLSEVILIQVVNGQFELVEETR